MSSKCVLRQMQFLSDVVVIFIDRNQYLTTLQLPLHFVRIKIKKNNKLLNLHSSSLDLKTVENCIVKNKNKDIH